MHILVLGHWDLSAEDLSGTGGAAEDALAQVLGSVPPSQRVGPNRLVLEAIRRGILSASKDRRADNATSRVEVTCLPFGPASALLEALEPAAGTTGNFFPLVHGRKEASSIALGSELRDSADFQGTIVIEGGHSWRHDWGLEMVGSMTGTPKLSLASDEETLRAALVKARDMLRPRTIVYATSTQRPLFGPGGTSVLRPDLSMRGVGRGQPMRPVSAGPADPDDAFAPADVAKWRSLLVEMYASTAAERQNLAATARGANATEHSDPGTLAGSGAGGGAGAVFAALGVPVVPTATVLSAATNLRNLLKKVDLVCVVEPRLDGPELADSALDHITTITSEESLPVVAVSSRSSLSSPERAEWGIHGVSLLREPRPGVGKQGTNRFEDVGRRIGQTWIPR